MRIKMQTYIFIAGGISALLLAIGAFVFYFHKSPAIWIFFGGIVFGFLALALHLQAKVWDEKPIETNESIKSDSTLKTEPLLKAISKPRKPEKHILKNEASKSSALINTVNQKGGNNIVNQYNEKPLPPLEDRVIEILDEINPEIIKSLKKQNYIGVCINQIHLIKLLEIEDSLKIKKIIRLQSTGSIASNNTNHIGNCINDLKDGFLNCFLIIKLDNFNNLFSNDSK